MKTIFRYIKPQAGRITLGLIIKFMGTVVELLLPWMLSVMIDEHVPQKNMRLIWIWGGLMVLCALFCLWANVTANRMSTRTSRDITQSIRSDLFGKITSLSCAQADHFTVPSLISRITSDTYNLHNMIDRMQRIGVRAPILLLGGITVTMVLDPVLTSVLILTLPLIAVVIWLVTSKGIRLYTLAQKKLDALIRRAQASMTGIRVIQALSKTEYEKEEFDRANTDAVATERRAGILMNITSPVMNLILNTGLTLVIIVGAYRVNGGYMQSGILIAFLTYFTIILNSMIVISRIFMMCTKGTASGLRIAEILNAPSEAEAKDIPSQKTDSHIMFEDVSFSYGKRKQNLQNISFSLKKGQTLGIIGPTGSGKSTLLRLLMGFYDPDKGRILINGRDILSIPKDELHSMFGVALQNDFLYAATIEENIAFERDISPEKVKEAARLAQADFILTREGGFEGTIAPKGQDLSGGQKQRLLIARAIAGEPEILILDDSSSALDYKTDAALRQELGGINSTKIIVAQRVSSVKDADLILVLDDGMVTGMGTHGELIQNCPDYCEIARIQMSDMED